MNEDAGPSQAAPAPAAPIPTSVMCSGVLRQRDPPIFSGTDDRDVEDWLLEYERCSAHNKWDNPAKLGHVIFYLTDVANLWFHNHEADFTTWSAFKETLTSFFGRPAVRKLRAEHSLRGRSQQIGETFTSYIEDVIALCRRANADMPESDKIKHIMKGIDDDAFHMLVAKNPQSVGEVIELCQSFDELRKQRISTRRPNTQTADLSALEQRPSGSDNTALLLQIQQYIREEVARQLSLVASVAEPPTSLDQSLRHVIQRQVAEALPPSAAPTHVAAPLTYAEAPVTYSEAPLTYAEAVVRPPAQPTVASASQVATYYTRPRPVRPVRAPFSPPRAPVNPWRTTDNRPICYFCGIPGHVARLCNRRASYFRDSAPTYGYFNQQPAVQSYGHFNEQPAHYAPPDASDSYSRRATYNARRSPSPRRRSISPMLRRSDRVQEEN